MKTLSWYLILFIIAYLIVMICLHYKEKAERLKIEQEKELLNQKLKNMMATSIDGVVASNTVDSEKP